MRKARHLRSLRGWTNADIQRPGWLVAPRLAKWRGRQINPTWCLEGHPATNEPARRTSLC
jgi:hypothetical protein